MTMTQMGAGPLYEAVAERLRTDIRSGKLAPGAQLPAERTLMETFDVSRNTIRLAIGQLTDEGLLVAGAGRRGTRVRSDDPLEWHLSSFEGGDRPDDPAAGLDAWSADVVGQGKTPRQEVTVEIVQPPAEIAAELDLDSEKDFAVVRRRIRYVDDVPAMLADSYFPEQLARGTALMNQGDTIDRHGILAAIGHPQKRWRDRITVRMPTKEETDRLRIPPGTPVAQHVRTGWGQDGDPLRVMVSVIPGSQHILVYEVDETENDETPAT